MSHAHDPAHFLLQISNDKTYSVIFLSAYGAPRTPRPMQYKLLDIKVSRDLFEVIFIPIDSYDNMTTQK